MLRKQVRTRKSTHGRRRQGFSCAVSTVSTSRVSTVVDDSWAQKQEKVDSSLFETRDESTNPSKTSASGSTFTSTELYRFID